MTPEQELELLLRPAGGGVYVVSTGREAQLAMQKRLYGARSEEDVVIQFREQLRRVADAKVVILAGPSDVGAGYVRGANLGPQAIRAALLDEDPTFPETARARGIVDLGDVFVVPQLLYDDMISDAQRRVTAAALYPSVTEEMRATLPVSPLSIAERALDLVLGVNPNVKVVMLGGDHSTAWPAVAALARARGPNFGIVQIDAHTDLLETRLGVKYCFATWSYHANDLLGRGGRMTQVGIRATRHDRGHWEQGLGVRQFWADECLRDPAAALDAIVAHVKSTGVRDLYFSNDIDGTDAKYADATGTPEPDGLEPDFLVELIRRLGAELNFIGGDVMEVAPPVQRTPDGAKRTVALAVRYLRATFDAL
ncbi:agmatinase [soil metagenome]